MLFVIDLNLVFLCLKFASQPLFRLAGVTPLFRLAGVTPKTEPTAKTEPWCAIACVGLYLFNASVWFGAGVAADSR